MPSLRHIHKYYRVNKARNVEPFIVYECRLGDCTHWLPIGSILGKRCVCWDCGKVFFMDAFSLQIKPRCKSCRVQRPYHKSKIKEYEDDLDPTGDVDKLLASLVKK